MLTTVQVASPKVELKPVAQKTKNTWPGMINHLIINGASALMRAF